MPLYFLVYVSAAETWFSPRELRALLDSAREHNQAAGITGMLLYKDGNFMQVLEGDEAAVTALFQRIRADRRHRGVVILDAGHAEERQFSGWSMGCVELDSETETLPAGYSHFMDVPLTPHAFAVPPTRCWQMLQVFRQLQ